MTAAPERPAPVDRLLDRAIAAVNRGDVVTARDLAQRVLATDASSRDAAALLEAGEPSTGELRRLTLLFCDLVGSTELSARHEPELYRSLVRQYTGLCREVIHRYRGHVSHIAGDGILAVFGLPAPRENDAERAVRAGLDIVRRLRALSADVELVVGERLEARAAVHRGLVYLDIQEDEVYGLAANVAARFHSQAVPGTLVISPEVLALVGGLFETEAEPPARVKGVEEPLRPFRVLAERAGAPARGRSWTAPLAGRTPELDLLRARWAGVRGGAAGGPTAVHLVGEPGMGKSRLAAAFAEGAGAEVGARVDLLGSPFHADASFHAVRVALEARIGLRRDAAAAASLAHLRDHLRAVGIPPDGGEDLVPVLAPVLGIAPDAGYRPVEADSGKLHEAITAGVVRYLLAALGPGPALLLVDDVHWCDAPTLEAVGRVVAAGGTGLLALTVSREGPPAALADVETVEVGPLDRQAATELVRSLRAGVDDAACHAVVERGDGVPLFLEELARNPEPATGPGAPGPAPGAVAGPRATGVVPEAVYELLVARLHASGPAVQVAGAAAAVGRDVDLRVLARAAGLPEGRADAAAEALVDAQVLDRVDGDRARFRFRHELVRIVAYDLQPPSRRRGVHRRLAGALIEEGGGAGATDWRLVANHYTAAGRRAEAAIAYQEAAEGARRLGALGEARALLGRAVDLVAGLADGHRRRRLEVGLRLRRGFLAASSEGNGSPEAVTDYERCLDLGASLGESDGEDALFSTMIPLFGYYLVRGDLARAEQVAGSLRTALAGGREHYVPDNEAAFGTIRWYAGDFRAASVHLLAAVEGVGRRPDSPDYARTYFMPNDGPGSAHAHLAVARFVAGDDAGADAQLEAARRRCRSIAFPQGPFTEASAESYAVWMMIERGDLDGAAAAADSLMALADRHGFDLWALIGGTEQATVAALADLAARPDDRTALVAHAEAVEGLCAVWAMVDLALFLPFFTTMAGYLRAAAGDRSGALAGYDETLATAGRSGVHFYGAEVMRLRARLLTGPGAEAQLRAALDVAQVQGATLFELRIARDLASLGTEGGEAALAEAAARFAPGARYPELHEAQVLLAGTR